MGREERARMEPCLPELTRLLGDVEQLRRWAWIRKIEGLQRESIGRIQISVLLATR